MRNRLSTIALCPRCHDDVTVENVLMAVPWDGMPIVRIAVACPCGMEGTMNVAEDDFDRFHQEWLDLQAAMHERAERMTHKVRSEIGREVAVFRDRLSQISTLEDIESW